MTSYHLISVRVGFKSQGFGLRVFMSKCKELLETVHEALLLDAFFVILKSLYYLNSEYQFPRYIGRNGRLSA